MSSSEVTIFNQRFPLNDDYQHTGEMEYGYYDEYAQSAAEFEARLLAHPRDTIH